MNNQSISITLPAKNSSGEQELHLTVQKSEKSEDEYYFTLTGRYDSKPIQIDFDEFSHKDLVDMNGMINLILEQ